MGALALVRDLLSGIEFETSEIWASNAAELAGDNWHRRPAVELYAHKRVMGGEWCYTLGVGFANLFAPFNDGCGERFFPVKLVKLL